MLIEKAEPFRTSGGEAGKTTSRATGDPMLTGSKWSKTSRQVLFGVPSLLGAAIAVGLANQISQHIAGSALAMMRAL